MTPSHFAGARCSDSSASRRLATRTVLRPRRWRWVRRRLPRATPRRHATPLRGRGWRLPPVLAPPGAQAMLVPPLHRLTAAASLCSFACRSLASSRWRSRFSRRQAKAACLASEGRRRATTPRRRTASSLARAACHLPGGSSGVGRSDSRQVGRPPQLCRCASRPDSRVVLPWRKES